MENKAVYKTSVTRGCCRNQNDSDGIAGDGSGGSGGFSGGGEVSRSGGHMVVMVTVVVAAEVVKETKAFW